MRKKISKELNQYKELETTNYQRKKKLEYRLHYELIIIFNKFVKKYFVYDKDRIEIGDSALILKDDTKSLWNRNYILRYYFDGGGYEVDAEPFRFINNNNVDDFLFKNGVVLSFVETVEKHKDELMKSYIEKKEDYSIFIEKLELVKITKKVDELNQKLKRIADDLLLEVGNIYVNKSKGFEYEILGHDDGGETILYSSKKLYSNHNITSTGQDREKFLSILKKSVPSKVTERKIKLKRVLDVG